MTTAQRIPGPAQSTDADMTFSSLVGEFRLQFRLKWNERLARWTLGIATSDGESIIDGIAVIADFDLLQGFADNRLPPGQLIASDSLNLGQAPGRNDWLERHQLMYGEFFASTDDQLSVDPREGGGPV